MTLMKNGAIGLGIHGGSSRRPIAAGWALGAAIGEKVASIYIRNVGRGWSGRESAVLQRGAKYSVCGARPIEHATGAPHGSPTRGARADFRENRKKCALSAHPPPNA